MKSYTDLEQSKKLAEILPPESADYFHAPDASVVITEPYKLNNGHETVITAYKGAIPCWSLAALLDVLPKIVNTQTLFIETSAALWHIGYRDVYIARSENPVDACYEMILKLHELNLL